MSQYYSKEQLENSSDVKRDQQEEEQRWSQDESQDDIDEQSIQKPDLVISSAVENQESANTNDETK